MKRDLKKSGKVSKNQEGIALITAIFSILLATVIGFALYYSSTIAFIIAANDRDNTEAFYIADAGINHATALLGKVPRSQYSAVLKAGANSTPDTGDELSVPPSSGLWATSESIPAGNASGGGVTNFGAGGVGRYWVAVKNDTATGETPTTDNNGVLVITSTGLGRNGASATVEVSVSMQNFPAILINSKARVAGNLSVKGSSGILHANDTLDLNGSPCADQYFSSTGNVLNPGNLKGAGCGGIGVSRSNQQIIQPPIYNIRNDFYNQADYILGSSGSRAGKVYNFTGPGGTEKMIYNTSSSGGTWQVGSSKWTWNIS
ncbi:MAG: pilus assembly PilX N-terminal domain-containing protein, partial [Pyrinomonadaceae bacterium]